MQIDTQLYNNIRQLLFEARFATARAVNSLMVQTYYKIGRLIVEDEQKGKSRAQYGSDFLKQISLKLTDEFGRGYSSKSLYKMRRFYITYSNFSTLSRKSVKSVTPLTKSRKLSTPSTIFRELVLSWSHYVFLMRLEIIERDFYEQECKINNWSLREFKRQYDSSLYERVAMSKDKKAVLQQNLKKYHSPEKPEDKIKDPYILEFLGLEEKVKYSEADMEEAIINKLHHFLLELGKGFSFIGRQQRFTFDEQHFFVDLVFYNRLLKCFVIVDIKTAKLTHQDLGQMQMYVNYYDRYVKREDENKTIGILLCKNKNDTLVKITLPEESKIYASKYQIYLPTKEELKKQLNSI